MFFPHIFVWGSCFWLCTPAAPSRPPPHMLTNNLLTHNLPTHNFLTYNSHTTCSHNLSTHTHLTHTQLAHTHNLLAHNLSSHNLLTHNLLTHRHFVWQWHLVAHLAGGHLWHWAGSGGALGPQWPPVVAGPSWRATPLPGRRGTWC